MTPFFEEKHPELLNFLWGAPQGGAQVYKPIPRIALGKNTSMGGVFLLGCLQGSNYTPTVTLVKKIWDKKNQKCQTP